MKMKKKKGKAGKRPDTDPMVQFRCVMCGTEELILKSVVDFFDVMDGGDPSFPPRFDCQNCAGKMQPVRYVGHDGIVYKI
jgi:hypothetical protein